MNTTAIRSAPPSQLLLALELRAFWELQVFFATYPLLRRAPRGDGHPVLVLPGLAASDTSTLKVPPTSTPITRVLGAFVVARVRFIFRLPCMQ